MKILRFLVVVICAIVLLRLAACTTGLAPMPTENLPNENYQNELLVVDNGNLSAKRARDAALSHIKTTFTEQLTGSIPGIDAEWEVKNTNFEQRLGWESRQFSTKDWLVSVGYPVVAPELVSYQVLIENMDNGFRWEGELNADFQLVTK